MGPNEEVELRIPNAIAGVRGSEAIMAYADGRTEFTGVEGRFEVTNPQDPTRTGFLPGAITGDYNVTFNKQGFGVAQAGSDSFTISGTGRITGFSGQTQTGRLDNIQWLEAGKVSAQTDGTIKVNPDGSSAYTISGGKIFNTDSGKQEGIFVSGTVNMSKAR